MGLANKLLHRAIRTYWKLAKPTTFGARAIVIGPDGSVLLIRHTYIDGWYLPGGGLKRGEAAHSGILREIREEVGLDKCRVDEVHGVFHSNREHKSDHIVVYIVRNDASGSVPNSLQASEVAEALWFPLDRLPENVSPATLRRLREFEEGKTSFGDW